MIYFEIQSIPTALSSLKRNFAVSLFLATLALDIHAQGSPELEANEDIRSRPIHHKDADTNTTPGLISLGHQEGFPRVSSEELLQKLKALATKHSAVPPIPDTVAAEPVENNLRLNSPPPSPDLTERKHVISAVIERWKALLPKREPVWSDLARKSRDFTMEGASEIFSFPPKARSSTCSPRPCMDTNEYQTRARARSLEEAELHPARIYATTDGGGIRGIGPATFYDLLQEAAGMSVVKMFDAVGGTSIGAILSAALATGHYSAHDLVNLLQTHGPHIFKRGFVRKITSLKGFAYARYDRGYLDNMLQQTLANTTLADVKIPISMVAVQRPYDRFGRLGRPAPLILNTYEARTNQIFNVPLWQAAAASAAAPGYFSPVDLEIGGKKILALDGGLIANAPDIETLLHGSKIYGEISPRDTLFAFRTGTPIDHTPTMPSRWNRFTRAINPFSPGGLFEQAGGVFDAMLDGQTTRAHELTPALLRSYGIKGYYEFNMPLSRLNLDEATEEYMSEIVDSVKTEFFDHFQEKYAPAIELLRHRAERSIFPRPLPMVLYGELNDQAAAAASSGA